MNNSLPLPRAVARAEYQAVGADPEIERVRRHIAKIQLQIKELDRRTRRDVSPILVLRVR